jgi:hypothetical protein
MNAVPLEGEVTFTLGTFWDGSTTPADGHRFTLRFSESELVVLVDAPYFGDKPPPGPVGSTPRLFEHEVAELFLLGRGARYLEVELSPHGHYWVLELQGRRNTVRDDRTLLYQARLRGARWQGCAHIPRSWLPDGLSHLNATAMHGDGCDRRYWSLCPNRGGSPDFHDLETFALIEDVFRARQT